MKNKKKKLPERYNHSKFFHFLNNFEKCSLIDFYKNKKISNK